MKEINVFIAGSLDLKEERQKIFASANELNAGFKSGKKVIFYTFNGVGNRMSTFKEFIRNKADIVLFLIKDKIGEYTEEEYKSAISNYHNNGYPHTYVLLHSYETKTSDIEHIEKLMKDSGDENFYITYHNADDLEKKVKRIIKIFPPKPQPIKKWLLGGSVFALLLILIFLLFCIPSKDNGYRFDKELLSKERLYKDSIQWYIDCIYGYHGYRVKEAIHNQLKQFNWYKPDLTKSVIQVRNEIIEDPLTIEYKNYKMLVNIRDFIKDQLVIELNGSFGKAEREAATFKIDSSHWFYKKNATFICVKDKYDWDSDSLVVIAYDNDSLKNYRGIFRGKLTFEGEKIKYNGVYKNKKNGITEFRFCGKK